MSKEYPWYEQLWDGFWDENIDWEELGNLLGLFLGFVGVCLLVLIFVLVCIFLVST
jgi:hypothetical protein